MLTVPPANAYIGLGSNLGDRAGNLLLAIRGMFEAGLIDEVGLNIHPVLLGSGIPVFYEMPRQIDLELVKCQELTNGCVVVTYRTKK